MSEMKRVALVWHGDRETRDTVKLEEHRLGPTAAGIRAAGMEPVAAVYNDDFADEFREQLLGVDAAQVWVNPIEQGRNRSRLDAVLREVANAGVLVGSHPSSILKMGTKDVLFQTKGMSWGSDVRVYSTLEQLRAELPAVLAEGRTRVLKQHRGHSGQGIWKVTPTGDPNVVRLRHALRGYVEHPATLDEVVKLFEPYFENGGRMIDQPFQDRIGDGMVRSYLVKDKVEGFGHQEMNALIPAPEGVAPEEAPQAGPRLYYPPTKPEFQAIKQRMESEWVPELMRTLDISNKELPFLWDIDLMFGPMAADGADTYVLCEINVSSVYPYPESAIEPLAKAIRTALSNR